MSVCIVSKDFVFRQDDFIFSYRVAGILIHDNKILLQRPKEDAGYSIPGGYVNYGETSAQALVREFFEEIKLDINIERLILSEKISGRGEIDPVIK